MNPRGYWGTAVMLAAMTALPFGLLMWLVLGGPLEIHVVSGMAFGLLFGGVMGFLFKSAELRLPVTGPEHAMDDLQMILAGLGYFPKSDLGGVVQFAPSFQAGLMAGRITVRRSDAAFDIVGPSMYLGKLAKRWPAPAG